MMIPTPKKRTKRLARISVVDIFCGAGGLTYGMRLEGLSVKAGIDIDPACRFPFEHNNLDAKFILRDVASMKSDEVAQLFPSGHQRILAGCAPCQPFSKYSRGHQVSSDLKWGLLGVFGKLACDIRPDVVSMENVPQLLRHSVYKDFTTMLSRAGYHLSEPYTVFGPQYGLPQHRTRLLFFASLLGPIELVPPTHSPTEYVTVEQAIKHLECLSAGSNSKTDPLHRSCRLSKINLSRIMASVPGGTWRDWPRKLISKCHLKDTGKTYPSVYGRMEWDRPAPTITTQFYGFGNGRFGHPEQNRSISLREGAILQTFPDDYQFVEPGQQICFKTIGRLIGNAVPVTLGSVVGKSIRLHLEQHALKKQSNSVERS